MNFKTQKKKQEKKEDKSQDKWDELLADERTSKSIWS